ncbi:hypothetical protein KC887_02720 [Candidatus Kaiserbacteria bacterium]|nr:hypothetical protein [Candidatus Kaiserbacteria bacterium]
MPWALDMALLAYGPLRLLPRSGGWHEQDVFELDALQMAHRVAKFYGRKPKDRKIEDESPQFFVWLEEDDFEVEYVSQLWMENTAV